MKIEKLNDHQIRCTLTKEDLAARHINLSELAYGTEKTKALFQDMMTQAAVDFGFEAEDIPLMIEAIPLSPEKIVLIITKVDSPEELDTRFSNFTHFDESTESMDADGPEDVLTHTEDVAADLADLLDKLKQDVSKDAKEKKPDADEPLAQNQIRRFSFSHIDEGIEAARAIVSHFQGPSTLYKDTRTNEYQLMIAQGLHSHNDFNRITHLMASYLKKKNCTPATVAFYREHGQLIISDNALDVLAKIE